MEPILKAQSISDRSWLVTMRGFNKYEGESYPMTLSVIIYLPYRMTPAEWFIDEIIVTECMAKANKSFLPIALLGFWPVPT